MTDHNNADVDVNIRENRVRIERGIDPMHEFDQQVLHKSLGQSGRAELGCRTWSQLTEGCTAADCLPGLLSKGRYSRQTAVTAPEQLGRPERHGGILKFLVMTIVRQHSVVGKEQLKQMQQRPPTVRRAVAGAARPSGLKVAPQTRSSRRRR